MKGIHHRTNLLRPISVISCQLSAIHLLNILLYIRHCLSLHKISALAISKHPPSRSRLNDVSEFIIRRKSHADNPSSDNWSSLAPPFIEKGSWTVCGVCTRVFFFCFLSFWLICRYIVEHT